MKKILIAKQLKTTNVVLLQNNFNFKIFFFYIYSFIFVINVYIILNNKFLTKKTISTLKCKII